MFLTKAILKREYGIRIEHIPVCHIANNPNKTLCKKYTPSEESSDRYIFSLFEDISLEDYLKGICLGKIQNPNMCKLCINTYKKSIIL
jgi:hypothetical protein